MGWRCQLITQILWGEGKYNHRLRSMNVQGNRGRFQIRKSKMGWRRDTKTKIKTVKSVLRIKGRRSRPIAYRDGDNSLGRIIFAAIEQDAETKDWSI